MKKKTIYKYDKVFKTTNQAHKTVVAHCKKTGNKIYVWVAKTLLAAIKQEEINAALDNKENN